MLAFALPVLAVSCARQEPPPGALVDADPPRVTEVRPADGEVVPDFDGELRVRFDEPIERPGDLERELIASPADQYRVDFGFSEIRIRPEEGWREDAVYTFTLPGGFRDLLGNRSENEIRTAFSTGPPVTGSRAEGRIVERVTGQPVQNARVLFLPSRGDSIPYTALTDPDGEFEVRALPPGPYRAYGFEDLNRDLDLDRWIEPYDSTSFELEGPEESASLAMRLTEPDTAPPRLVEAAFTDSITLVLRFDDHLDPEQDFAAVDVAVRDTADGTVREGERVRSPPEERLDGAEEGAPPEEAGGHADETRPLLEEAGRPAAADTAPLPAREAEVRLGRPLRPAVYRVVASGFRNLRNLAGGGDTLVVYEAPADEPGEREPEDGEDSGGEAPVDRTAGEPGPEDGP